MKEASICDIIMLYDSNCIYVCLSDYKVMMMFILNLFIFLMVGCRFDALQGSNKKEEKAKNQSEQNRIAYNAIIALVGQPGVFDSPTKTTTVINRYNSMIEGTPEHRKQQVADLIAPAVAYCHALQFGENEVDANDNIGAFMSSDTESAKLFKATSKDLSSPVKRQVSCVNARHASEKKRKFDRNGNVEGYEGSHNADEFTVDEVLTHKKYDCFIGQDNETIGGYLEDKYPKTARFGFTEEEVIHNSRNGKTVAVSPENKNLVVSRSPRGYLVESYINKNNELHTLTQYPVYKIDPRICNSSGDIYAGRFASFKKDPLSNKIMSNDFECHNGQGVIRVTLDRFNKWMKSGKALDTKNNDEQLVDITDSFTHYCYQDYLKAMGKHEMPGKVYGIRTQEPLFINVSPSSSSLDNNESLGSPLSKSSKMSKWSLGSLSSLSLDTTQSSSSKSSKKS